MKNKEEKDLSIISEGINAVAGILSLVNPIFATVPLFVFGVNRVINLVQKEDIINRLMKFEEKLEKGKINIDEFKEKLNSLNEHERYVLSNNLNKILLECIPETVDIYISVFIDYVMKQTTSFEEDLFEIISSLNASDLKVLISIKEYLNNGIRENYKKSIQREKYIKKLNEDTQKKNEIARIKNQTEDLSIKYIDDMPMYYEYNERFGKYTIFWKDFATSVNLDSNITISKLLLFDYYESDYSDWTYMGRSFVKLDKMGIIEMEFINTPGNINSLNIDRFHLTNYCLEILKYLDEKKY